MAMLMLLVSREPERFYTWLGAMSAAMAVTTIVLLAAGPLIRRLGERGTAALERLMGLLLCAISIEMLLAGIRNFIDTL
jgi:small neutral amino acid transporter SnatA (MarC family)